MKKNLLRPIFMSFFVCSFSFQLIYAMESTKITDINPPLTNNELALRYRYGSIGFPKNLKKAAELYYQESNKGSAEAKNALGEMYLQDSISCTNRDIQTNTAFKLFSDSSKKGYPPAKNNLANMYRRGIDITSNPKKALELYIKASDLGYHEAQKNLAEIYLYYYSEFGVPKDENKAIELCTKSSNQGNIQSKLILEKINRNLDITQNNVLDSNCKSYNEKHQEKAIDTKNTYQENKNNDIDLETNIEIDIKFDNPKITHSINDKLPTSIFSPSVPSIISLKRKEPPSSFSLQDTNSKEPRLEFDQEDKCDITHIKGTDDHRTLLKEMISSALRYILITTQSITWMDDDIFNPLINAAKSNVVVHIVYNNKVPTAVENQFKYLQKNYNFTYEKNSVHAKYLIIDNSHFVIGSHNWLDLSQKPFSSKMHDCSIKISGNFDYIKQLKTKVLEEIVSNRTGPSRKEKDVLIICETGKKLTKFELITTLKDHEQLLRTMSCMAKKCIQIYSPFVHVGTASVRLNYIAQLIKKDVLIYLFVGEFFEGISDFINNHEKLKHITKVKLDTTFHRKTLIIDNKIITEGSFNWLSTTLDINSGYYNLDSTLLLPPSSAIDIINKDSHIQSNISSVK